MECSVSKKNLRIPLGSRLCSTVGDERLIRKYLVYGFGSPSSVGVERVSHTYSEVVFNIINLSVANGQTQMKSFDDCSYCEVVIDKSILKRN